MGPYEEVRAGLVSRYARLARRLGGIRQDLGMAHGQAIEDSSEAGNVLTTVIDIVEAIRHELGLIREALRAMSAGRYGQCSRCGKTIGLQRLQLLPYAANCEACAPGLDLDTLNQLRIQHLGVRQLLCAIGEVLTAHRDGEEPRSRHDALIALLGDLARELPEHFALEEEGGYFSDIIGQAPRLSREAEQLYKEHAELRQQSRELFNLARCAPMARAIRRDVKELFTKLSAHLTAHEDAENALIQKAFHDDVGAPD